MVSYRIDLIFGTRSERLNAVRVLEGERILICDMQRASCSAGVV